MCLDVLDIRNSSPLLVFGGGVVLWNRLSLAIDLQFDDFVTQHNVFTD